MNMPADQKLETGSPVLDAGGPSQLKAGDLPPQVAVTTFTELTIDGRVNLTQGGSSMLLFRFYGSQLQQWFHRQRAAHDAIMVGAGIVRSDNPQLTVRHVVGTNPLRVIATNDGNLPPNCHVLTDGLPTLLAVPDDLPPYIADQLQRGAVSLLKCGPQHVDFHRLMADLAQRGIRSLMVEGDSRILSGLFAAKLVNRLVIKHIPVIAGCAPDKAPGASFLSYPAAGLELSQRQVVDWRVIGGVGVSVYEPMAGAGS